MRHESCESRQHETWTIGGAGTGEGVFGAFFWWHGRNGRVLSLFMSPLLEGYVMDNGLTTRDGYFIVIQMIPSHHHLFML